MQVPSLLKKSKTNSPPTAMPESPLRLGAYRYKPVEDITVYELAKLLEVFTFAFNAAVMATKQYDYEPYITQHKLERHFTKD